MNKIIYRLLFTLVFIVFYNCNQENDNQQQSLDFSEPTTEFHFTQDSCKTNDWEIRDFKITIPKSFKINKKVTANYIELERELEYLYFGSAGVDLNMALATDYTDKKIQIKDTEGYSLYFDEARNIVDRTVVEVVVNNLINYYLKNTNAALYSKEPKQNITINNMPANYSGFTMYGTVKDKEVWSHTAVIFVPNPNDISKLLFGVFTINTEVMQIFTAEDFLETDSYKIISSINFS